MDLAAEIRQKYQQALASKSVIFVESQVSLVSEESIKDLKFQVRFAYGLVKKPIQENIENKSQQQNPFLPYDPALHVADLDQHVILLNKFSVAPHHILLVTKEYKSQSSPLYPNDLMAAYKCLTVLSENSVAFYNCGNDSGASQPHKHIQIIPCERPCPIDFLLSNLDGNPGKIMILDEFPFAHFITKLSAMPTEESLGDSFINLLETMIDSVRRAEANSPYEYKKSLSYNVIITKRWMMIVPRSTADAELGGERISINSLGFVGMILIKTRSHLDAIRQAGVLKVLRSVGYEKMPLDQQDEPEGLLYGT